MAQGLTSRLALAGALLGTAMTANAGSFRFEGNTAVSDDDLAQIAVALSAQDGMLLPDASGTEAHLGALDVERLSNEAVAEVIREVSRHYQSRQILGTRVQVTRESLEASRDGGDLVVMIREGRVDSVRVTAFEGGEVSDATRERLLVSSVVRPGGLIDGRAIEASLATMNRFAFSQAQPVLLATEEGTVLEYRVRQRKRWSLDYTMDNYGSERTGEVRHQLDGGLSALLGEDDRLSLTAIVTKGADSRYLRTDYFTPLDGQHRHRLRVSVHHSGYSAEDIGVAAFDFEGASNGASLAYETTLWSSGGRFLDVGTGLRFLDAAQDQSDVGIPEASTSFLLPFVNAKLSQRTTGFSGMLGLRLETNLPELGGTEADELAWLGRYNASEDFVIGRVYGGLRAFLDRNERAHEVTLNGSYTASLAGDRLPASFLNVVGGHSTVRGYRLSTLSGDDASHAQLEYRIHLMRLLESSSRWNVSASAFYDWGRANNLDVLPFEVDESISAFGLGLRLTYGDRLETSVEYARTAEDLVTPYEEIDSGETEVYLKTSLRF